MLKFPLPPTIPPFFQIPELWEECYTIPQQVAFLYQKYQDMDERIKKIEEHIDTSE